jgi:AraC family transcriptional regulator
MIMHDFPDLQWLKTQIDQRFRNRLGYGNIPLDEEGFPSVIINTRSFSTYRPDVRGPVSLFLNLTGKSHCTVDNRRVTIHEDFYFISNRDQYYTLEIESDKPVETFNIHVGESFSEGVFSAWLTPAKTILDHGREQKLVTVHFHNQLHRKLPSFIRLVQKLKASRTALGMNRIMFEETMTELLVKLLHQHRDIENMIAKMPAIKSSTRQELYRRLSYSLDYLHGDAEHTPDINEMAGAACISKFHFLRLFRQTFGLSPYQYWQQLRIDKAEALLKQTTLPVQAIADQLGFESASSFSRLFKQRRNLYPSQYRAK